MASTDFSVTPSAPTSADGDGGASLNGVETGSATRGLHWPQVQAPNRPEGAIYSPPVVDDAKLHELVMYAIPSGWRSVATWTWNGTTWTHLDTAPPYRARPAMAHDKKRREVVMFGGDLSSDGASTNQTWVLRGATWSQVHAASSPSPRYGATVAYDPTLEKVVLFGGFSGGDDRTYFSDTWAFDARNWTRLDAVRHPPERHRRQRSNSRSRGIPMRMPRSCSGATTAWPT